MIHISCLGHSSGKQALIYQAADMTACDRNILQSLISSQVSEGVRLSTDSVRDVTPTQALEHL